MAGRITQECIELLQRSSDRKGRITQECVEVVQTVDRKARASQVVVEVLQHTGNKYVDHELTFSQTVFGQKNLHTVQQSLTFVQTILFNIRDYVFTQTLTINSTVSRQVIYARSIAHTLTFTQSTIPLRAISSTLTFSQTITPLLLKVIKHTVFLVSSIQRTITYNKAITSTLTFSSNIVRDGTPTRKITSTLTFAQKINVIRTVKSVLTFSQTVTKQAIYNRAITSSLTFNSVLSRNATINRSIIDTLSLQHLRPFEYSTNANLTPDSVNGIQVQVIKNLVIMKTRKSVIILPPPLFGDSEVLAHTLNRKISMNGVKRTYVKRSNRAKIIYTYSLDFNKSLELKRFYETNIVEKITLINFKGETWVGNLTAQPEFSRKGRFGNNCGIDEEVIITVEFDGIQVG